MENSIYKTHSLLIVFGELPKLGITVNHPKQQVIIDETLFLESILGEFNGHYDWLGNHSGQIIGVRYCMFEDLKFLSPQFKRFSYCEVDDETLTIYFSDDRIIDVDNSIDQDFTGDRIFYSDHCELAMSFYIEGKNKESLLESIKYDYGDVFEF